MLVKPDSGGAEYRKGNNETYSEELSLTMSIFEFIVNPFGT